MQTHWSRYAPLCGPHARTFHSIRERNEKVETRDARGKKKKKKRKEKKLETRMKFIAVFSFGAE